VVSGSADKTARVWEASTGEEIARMTHDSYVYSVAFSSDGKFVLSGSDDHTARVWIYRPEDLIAEACSRETRNLTGAEWKQYIGDALSYQAVCPNLPLDFEYLKAIAKDVVSNTNDPNRVKNAFDSIKAELMKVNSVKNPSAEAHDIVAAAVNQQISAEVASYNIEKALDLFEQAKQMQISINNADTLNSLCWYGSLRGYTEQVLQTCEAAVKLSPDDAYIRDSRGLARTLTGDFENAILDFQYFVDHSNDSTSIEQRKQWIEQLNKGINPFTPEILESLK
jgi:tetratricopeptide (TPR) repeat protein